MYMQATPMKSYILATVAMFTHDQNLVIMVPADVLAAHNYRPSGHTVITEIYTSFPKSGCGYYDSVISELNDIIQNRW